MRRRPAKLVALVAALLGSAATAQAAAPPLRLCADPSNLPFSTNEPDAVAKGHPGMYVEIGRAVAQALGRPLEIVWSLSYFEKRNLRTTLLAGLCDFVVGLPAIRDFMGPNVIFTRPILQIGYALVLAKTATVRSIDDLRGQRVAVQFSSPPQSMLAERADISAVTVMDPEEGMKRLASGDVDAAILWGPSAAYLNHEALGDRFAVIPLQGPRLQWQAAIGVSKDNAALRDQVDAVLDGLAAEIRGIFDKYAGQIGAPIVLTAGPPAMAAAASIPATAGGGEKGDSAAGKVLFNGTCAHCHGPDAIVAERRINLRLLKQRYGDRMAEVFFTTVTAGRPTKGMPAWKSVFTAQDFANIFAYLKTVQNK